MTLTDRIEELARLYEARDGGGQAELWAWSTAVDDDWPKLLPVLSAAVEYAKYREAMSLERLVAAVEEATRE